MASFLPESLKHQGKKGTRGPDPVFCVLVSWCLSSCFLCSLLPADTGQGKSPMGSLDSRERSESDFARQFNQAFEGKQAGGETEVPPNLAFRASLQDANGNGVAEPDELISLIVSIENTGPGAAQGVTDSTSGSSQLAVFFNRPLPPASISPGASLTETLLIQMPKKLTAENNRVLIVRVREARPEWSPTGEAVLPVTVSDKVLSKGAKAVFEPVDAVPERRLTSDAAIGVVIGVSRYRSKDIPVLANARHDAEVVCQYFENVCGVKAENVFTLYDDQATRENLETLFGSRLPNKIMPGDRVYIYFAGMGAQSASRAPLLVPYDGTAGDEAGLYPVEKLVGEASQWETEMTVVLLDAGFSGRGRVLAGARGRSAAAGAHLPPVNMAKLVSNDRCAIITAADSIQGALDLAPAKHGLFTYSLLRGLRGDADDNPADGWITLKELYDYVRSSTAQTALDKLNEFQDPVMRVLREVEGSVSGWRVAKSQ